MTTKKTTAKKNTKKTSKPEILKVKSEVKAGTLASSDSINCKYGTSSNWCC